MTKQERIEKQQHRLQEMLSFERELWSAGKEYIAGVDEVGRGPLAGPVVTAAVVLPKDFSLLGVDDSKKLSPKRREELFEQIKEAAVCWAIGRREPDRIDAVNILEAIKEAMLDAVKALPVKPDTGESDQRPRDGGDGRNIPGLRVRVQQRLRNRRPLRRPEKAWPLPHPQENVFMMTGTVPGSGKQTAGTSPN